MQDTVPEQTTRPQQMKAGPRRIPGNSLKSWVPRRLLAVKQNTFTAEVLGDHPAHHRWGQTEKNYMSPCGEATPELLSSSSHSVLHECIYPLGRCPSNAILASPGWRITCNMILPHLSLTHVPGSVGNARRAPWLLPSMFLAPCQNSQSMNWASLVAQMVKYRFFRRQVSWSGIPMSWRIFHSLLWSTLSKALA